jgi:hypothetical protein
MSMTPEEALDLLIKTNISPENVRREEAVLRQALLHPTSWCGQECGCFWEGVDMGKRITLDRPHYEV